MKGMQVCKCVDAMAMATQMTRCWSASWPKRLELENGNVRCIRRQRRYSLKGPSEIFFLYRTQSHSFHTYKPKLFATLPMFATKDDNQGSQKVVVSDLSSSGNETTIGTDEEEEMNCIGTAMDVECVTSFNEVDGADSLGKRPERVLTNTARQTKNEKTDSESSLIESVLDTLLLLSPFFFWGTAMVAMKGILPKAGPMFVASTRLIPAGALVIGFASAKGKKMPAGSSAWFAIALFGLVDATCFQGFLTEGLRRTSAGLGSVIIDSQPLTVAILASILFGETLGPIAIVGLGLGVVGLVLLEVPLEVLQNIPQPGGTQDVVQSTSSIVQPAEGTWSIWDSGEWWMLLAAQSMAVGTVMVRWVSKFSDPIMATGWHMILGGLPLLALSVWQQDPAISGHIQDLSASDWAALFYTSVFGSAISYGVFFYNATKGNLTKLSSLTFLTPMFAAFFGYLLLDEKLNGIQLAGASVTLLSIYLVNRKLEPDSEKSD